MSQSQIQAVIGGSYRKHLNALYRIRLELEKSGIAVLSPVGSEATNSGDEFILLNADPIQDKRTLQDSIFAKMRMSTFYVLANIDG